MRYAQGAETERPRLRAAVRPATRTSKLTFRGGIAGLICRKAHLVVLGDLQLFVDMSSKLNGRAAINEKVVIALIIPDRHLGL